MSMTKIRASSAHAVWSGALLFAWATLAHSAEPVKRELPTWTSATLAMKDGEAAVLRFSPDGKILALATGGLLKGGNVKLLDPTTLQELPVQIETRLLAINALAFAPDGKRLVAASGVFTKVGKDFKVVSMACIVDLKTGKTVAEFGREVGGFYSACFSPDGKSLAAGDRDGNVKVWDVGTKKEQLAIKAHRGGVHDLLFADDGKFVVSAGEDGPIHIADAATGAKSGILDGHRGGTRRLLLLKDRKTLVSAGNDGEVRVWDLSERKHVRSFAVAEISQTLRIGPDGKPMLVGVANINDLSIAADESWLAVGLFRTVKIFDLASGKQLAQLTGHTGQLKTACFSPDGKTLASGDNFDARLWSAPLPAEGSRIFKTGENGRFALSKDGSLFARSSSSSSVQIWDRASGTVKWEIKAHDEGVYVLAFSPDGKLLATGSFAKIDQFEKQGEVKLWNAETGKLLRTLKGHEDRVFRLAFAHDGKTLATGGEDRIVKLWDPNTGDLLDTLKGHSFWLSRPAFSPDGKRLVTTSVIRQREELIGSELLVWNVEDGRKLLSIEEKSHSLALPRFSGDGKSIFFFGLLREPGEPKVLFRYDAASFKQQDKIELPKGTYAIALSSDETLLAIGIANDVHLWDLATRKPLKVLRGHSSGIDELVFGPDATFLLSAGSSDGTVREWDLRTLLGKKQ